MSDESNTPINPDSLRVLADLVERRDMTKPPANPHVVGETLRKIATYYEEHPPIVLRMFPESMRGVWAGPPEEAP